MPDISEFTSLKGMAATIVALTVIVTTVVTFDTRYVHAGDLTEFKAEHTRAIQMQSIQSQAAINDLRRQTLEDKIFEIQLIPPARRSDVDRARLDKYTRDLENTKTRSLEIRNEKR